MTIKSGMFNSVNRDRVYKAEDFASYFASFIGDGVFPNPSTGLKVTEGNGMNLVLKPGRGWIKGYYLVNDSDYTIKLDTADAILKRIDRIVMQLNFLDRSIKIVVKKGVYASSPTPQPMVRTSDIYELVLADVLINQGDIKVTQAYITDQRLNTELCGIVHGVVNQVDTTDIFNQYQTWFIEQKALYETGINSWTNDKKIEFENWFLSIRDILNGDVAGNLLTLIEKNQSDIRSVIKHRYNITIPNTGWITANDYYYYDLSDVDITDNSIVDVNVKYSDLQYAGVLSSSNDSFNGYLRLYAIDIPERPFSVDLRISKEVI